jgi:hypothetical protein
MTTYIADKLRQEVIDRASACCEYCRLPQRYALYSHEVDHIIAEKHRGQTISTNLCLACLECNRHKGSDFASFDPQTGQIAVLFNPRQQFWTDHFQLHGVRIDPLTPTGRVTVFVLRLNDPLRLRERQLLAQLGVYPPPP